MINMIKSKKGIGPIALIMALFIGILLLIFLTGGGIKAAFDLSRFISNVPTPIWFVLGIIVLFKLLGGKKK